MTLLDLQKQINDLIKASPEVADLEVMQTSCFDDPYRFETTELSVGEAHEVVHETGEVYSIFNNEVDAQQRADDEDCVVREKEVVVIGSY